MSPNPTALEGLVARQLGFALESLRLGGLDTARFFLENARIYTDVLAHGAPRERAELAHRILAGILADRESIRDTLDALHVRSIIGRDWRED